MNDTAVTDSHAPAAARSISHTATYALIALIASATAAFHLSGPLGPDVSWLITVSERILDGGRLYVDILEPNPPMAGWLYLPPVWLARLLGLAPELLVIFWTIGFGLITTGFAARLVAEHRLLKYPELFWPVALLLFLSAWGEDFAQREHFAAMAGLVLFTVMALRATGIRPRPYLWIIAGIAGGFVLSIKPHFALPIFLAALYVAWRQRSIRPIFAPEMWLAGTIFLAFCAATALFYPDFFTNIMPAATAAYIPDRRPLWMLLLTRATVYFEVIMLIALIGFRRQFKLTPLLGLLLSAALGFFLSYLAQGRGYAYQILPGTALVATYVLLSFSEQRSTAKSLIDSLIPLAGGVVLAAMPMLHDTNQWKMRQPIYDALAPYGPGLSIVNITPNLTATSPLHRLLHARLVNSPPGLLMSMSVVRMRLERGPDPAKDPEREAIEISERTTLREDMKRYPPDIIVTTGEDYDWLEWARKDPEIATMLTGYEEIANLPFDSSRLRLLKRHGLEPKL